MRKEKKWQGLPLLIMTLTLTFTLIKGMLINNAFGWQLYAGLISTAVCAITYIVWFSWYKYILAFLLALGSLNLVHFTFTEVTIDFSLKVFNVINLKTIEFQIFSLLVFSLHLIINRRTLIKGTKNILAFLFA